MPIELIKPKHSFYKMTVPGHPDLERVMTNGSDPLILPKAVHWARDTCDPYDCASFELQSPEDAWIARLAQDDKKPIDPVAFDHQITRGLALCWFYRRKPVITVYIGIPDNLVLTNAQKGHDSLQKTGDWQVPLNECSYIRSLQYDSIRPYPGKHVKLSISEVERDPLTQDIFGEATPLVAKYLSDRKYHTVHEYFPSIDGIKPRHARVWALAVGGGSGYDDRDGIFVAVGRLVSCGGVGRARGVRVGGKK
jgi:hypothetical protein